MNRGQVSREPGGVLWDITKGRAKDEELVGNAEALGGKRRPEVGANQLPPAPVHRFFLGRWSWKRVRERLTRHLNRTPNPALLLQVRLSKESLAGHRSCL